MAKDFNNLLRSMEPARRDRIRRQADAELEKLALSELRRARHLTQAQVAQTLGIAQAGVSRIEHQADIYLSTLRRFVEAMGGELTLVATFPEGRVEIERIESTEPVEAVD